MDSDKRTNPRQAVEFDAVLNYESHAVICTVRDISVGGAFLETDPSELPITPQVEISMSIPTREGVRFHRMPVLIRRVSDRGAGISFSHVDQDAYFSLTDLVYGPSAA